MNGGFEAARRRVASGAALLLALMVGAACGDGQATTHDATEHVHEAASHDHHELEADMVVLDSARIAVAGIRVDTVAVVESSALRVTGAITYDQDRYSHIGPKGAGRIVELRADLGSRVRAGQVLALLESAEVGALRAGLAEAETLVRIAGENREREARLEAQGISSRREVLEAEAELARAEAAHRSIREQLRVLGAEGGEGGSFALVAPFDGVVVEKHASRGEVVGPESTLFTVADLSELWIELDIFERDLRRVAPGQRVAVSVEAYPGRVFEGAIVRIGDVVDPATRAVRARVEVRNRDGALKPGMFASAVIRVGGGEPLVVVPQDAVQQTAAGRVVFVPGEHAGEYRAQPVELGDVLEDGRVVVQQGLVPGARVVVAGAFALRSELARGEFGEHSH